MRRLTLILVAALTCTGCISVSLKNHTERQIKSLATYRETASLQCLAVIADNPDNLPPFSNLADGVAQVQDTLTVGATTLFAHSASALGFSQQNVNPLIGRSPKVQWNIAPLGDYTQLVALRCACRWVVYGPPGDPCDPCYSILADPQIDHSTGPHYGVADRLANIPRGWLHISHGHVPPVGDRYRAHFGDTWVWVMPEDVAALNEFILVLLDISTLNIDASPNPAEAQKVVVHLTVVQKTPHVYDLSEVSDVKLQEIIKPKPTAEEIQQLKSALNGAFVVNEDDFIDMIKRNSEVSDKFKIGNNAKSVAALAMQPHAYAFDRIPNQALETAGLKEINYTNFRSFQNQSNKRYYGRREDVLHQLQTDLATSRLQLKIQTKSNAPDEIQAEQKKLGKTFESLLDLAQVPLIEDRFDFTKASGLADAGLTPDQILKLRSNSELARTFFGTESDFIDKMLNTLKEPTFDGLKAALSKVANAAKAPSPFSFSKDLTFEQDRVIRPEFLDHIRHLIQNTPVGQAVPISWDDWLASTEPFHGSRSNVRADGSISPPVNTPARPNPPRIAPLLDLEIPSSAKPQLQLQPSP